MSDPRFTDPYDRNSQLSDPVLRRDQSVDRHVGLDRRHRRGRPDRVHRDRRLEQQQQYRQQRAGRDHRYRHPKRGAAEHGRPRSAGGARPGRAGCTGARSGACQVASASAAIFPNKARRQTAPG